MCTTFVNDRGVTVPRKVARRQVRHTGHVKVDAPEWFVTVSGVEFSEATRRFSGLDAVESDYEVEPF